MLRSESAKRLKLTNFASLGDNSNATIRVMIRTCSGRSMATAALRFLEKLWLRIRKGKSLHTLTTVKDECLLENYFVIAIFVIVIVGRSVGFTGRCIKNLALPEYFGRSFQTELKSFGL